ncbi:MAG TPA: hypothetical protein PKH91_07710, partial [Flavobacterium sp.]|nr:hypothetical protein [Flavobacterium sp.]
MNTDIAVQINGLYLQLDGTLGAAVVWQTQFEWEIDPVPHLINVVGLTPNTLYSYALKARNGDGVETAFGPSQTVTTLPNTEPSLTADPLTGFGSVCINETAGPNSFGLLGEFLTGDVTVGPLDGFSFSTTEANPSYSSSLTLTPDGNDEILEIIYVKFTPTAVVSYDGDILISGGGASDVNVGVTGSGVDNVVEVVTGASSSVTATSATITGTITPGCSTVSSSGLEYSTANDMSGSVQVSNPATLSGLEPNTQYFYRGYATDDSGTVTGTILDFTTSQLSAPVGLPASDITATSFVANWETVDGADGYRLDVSTSPFTVVSSTPWINEFHYEDAGTDGNEFIEIVVPTSYAGTGLTLTLYNGSGGGSYGTYTLGSMVEGETNGNFTFYSVTTATDGIQNGAPDGFALSDSSGLISFLSYEGSFTATNGPASGQTSTAVSVSESTSTLDNSSIHLVGSGSSSSSFTWVASLGANTKGLTNSGQELISAGVYLVNNLDVGDVLSHEVTGLTAETTYYYRVRATSLASTSASSSPAISVITAAAPPTFGGITQSIDVACDNSVATFFISGLVANSVSTITYNIDGGSDVTLTGVTANASNLAIVGITLQLINNGQILTVTKVERTDVSTPVLNVIENNEVVLAVTSNSTFYADNDGDSFGDPTSPVTACEAPFGYVLNNTDCDDTIASVNPGMDEIP